MKNQKLSAQLPIGSYAWAKARLRENTYDPYALAIVLEHELTKRPSRGRRAAL